MYQGSEVNVGVMEVTENVDKFLQEIEKKYSLNSDILPKNDFEEQLHILSQVFPNLFYVEIFKSYYSL
jgi:hypothetical protein